MRWAASDVSFGFGGVLLLCGVFVSSFASVWNPEFSAQLDLDDRQGFIASSAMQQKKKKKGGGAEEVASSTTPKSNQQWTSRTQGKLEN